MNKLYQKNELLFAILWIIIYIVAASVGDALSSVVGIEKVITLAVLAVVVVVLFAWIFKNNLSENMVCVKAAMAPKRFYFIFLF